MAQETSAGETTQDNEYGIPQDVYEAIRKEALEEGRQLGLTQAVEAVMAQQRVLRKLSLDAPIEELELSIAAYNYLRREKIDTIGDLMARSVQEIGDIHKLGEKRVGEIVTKLAAAGYELPQRPHSS